MAAATQLLTADEYAQLPEDGRLTELVRGEIVEMNQPTPRHGQVCSNVLYRIRVFTESTRLGHVLCNDTGILTERNPDTVRGGDVWFISYDKIPPGPLPSKYLRIPPDLVFEVLSPSNSRMEILQKVTEYINAGVTVVCILDPDERTAHLYYKNKPDVILKPDETFTVPEVLPGFSIEVDQFFQ